MYRVPRKLYELRIKMIHVLVFEGEDKCKDFLTSTLSKFSVYEMMTYKEHLLEVGDFLSRFTGVSFGESIQQIIEKFRIKSIYLSRLERYIESL